ncbi:MAG: murein biosynthesis integral membrane protein MurJ [Oscillochloris sp.]|nr:murein biosynthesis integral membrane protein MurJ [Oscillochloris sp.]
MRSVAFAALLISLGNIVSRVLGFVREPAIAFYFGRGVEAEAFRLAWTVPNTIYDMLISGAVAAALVPVFSELAEGERDEFWQVVSGVITVALAALTALTALAVWQAPLLVALLAPAGRPELRELVTGLVRLLMPAVLLMGTSGLVTSILHAQRRFLLPAFTMASFNAGMIAGLVLFHDRFGVHSLAAGAFLGGLAQVLLQMPGLRGSRLRPSLRLGHPAVRRILWLYGPVAIGIGFSIVGTLIDRRLAAGFSAALATMGYATTLVQFPLGLVASAVALAVLPTLSRQNAAAAEGDFRATLAMGLKVVLLLILPATAGLAALAFPVVSAIFARGAFDASDVGPTALALLLYLPGLPAAALDQVLIFAFYARKNTLTPNLIQGAAILCYLAAALPLIWLTELGFLALVIGNSAQWIGHALITYWLLSRAVSLRGQRLGEAFWKGMLAAVLSAAAAWSVAALAGELPDLVRLLLAGPVGVAVYLGACVALRLEAFGFFLNALRSRLRPKG